MMTLRKRAVSIYADRLSQQWIVRDPDGNYWIVPVVDEPWDHRQPFDLTEEIEFEDEKGKWHTETARGSDRPDTRIKDKE